jgi:hypothetical protein
LVLDGLLLRRRMAPADRRNAWRSGGGNGRSRRGPRLGVTALSAIDSGSVKGQVRRLDRTRQARSGCCADRVPLLAAISLKPILSLTAGQYKYYPRAIYRNTSKPIEITVKLPFEQGFLD